jgi:NADH-quinone oxidoreductase subunit H
MLLNCIGAAIFVTKALAIIFVQMWIRWTLPRPRIDQVLYACVKVLLPLACVLLLGRRSGSG